jgi:hypothetical protein
MFDFKRFNVTKTKSWSLNRQPNLYLKMVKLKL